MNANIEKYKALDGIRTYSAIGIVLMHVFENSDYYCIPNYISTKLDLLKWLVYL